MVRFVSLAASTKAQPCNSIHYNCNLATESQPVAGPFGGQTPGGQKNHGVLGGEDDQLSDKFDKDDGNCYHHVT
jgi:hypothetical protein